MIDFFIAIAQYLQAKHGTPFAATYLKLKGCSCEQTMEVLSPNSIYKEETK